MTAEQANRVPDLPGANSPYAIGAHCVGMADYWGGSLIAGLLIPRDRDSEFRAHGDPQQLCAELTRIRNELPQHVAIALTEGVRDRTPAGHHPRRHRPTASATMDAVAYRARVVTAPRATRDHSRRPVHRSLRRAVVGHSHLAFRSPPYVRTVHRGAASADDVAKLTEPLRRRTRRTKCSRPCWSITSPVKAGGFDDATDDYRNALSTLGVDESSQFGQFYLHAEDGRLSSAGTERSTKSAGSW